MNEDPAFVAVALVRKNKLLFFDRHRLGIRRFSSGSTLKSGNHTPIIMNSVGIFRRFGPSLKNTRIYGDSDEVDQHSAVMPIDVPG
jgi:hypothetical protein